MRKPKLATKLPTAAYLDARLHAPAIVEAYAPETANDGAPIPAATHERFETSLLSLYGGFTRGPDISGAWRDPETGIVYRERNRSYRVVVPGDRAITTLHSLKSDIEILYGQHLAYVTVSPLIASTIN